MQNFKFKIQLTRNIAGIISDLEIFLETNSDNDVDLMMIINCAIQTQYPRWKLKGYPMLVV